jgi:hypothetical protein
MRHIILITWLISLLNCAYGQTVPYNLKHLTREDYVRQIELCTDSAYTDAGMPGVKATYDENTYDWVIDRIDKVVKKNFADKITQVIDQKADIHYSLVWYRDKKYLYIGLTFFFKGKSIGQSYVLYGIMTKDSVQGIIKLFSTKKEMKRIFQEGIK